MVAGELIAVGEEAPDFTLLATSGELETLRDYRHHSNVCLFFYPREEPADACPPELGAARDARDAYIARDVERMGVHPGSLESQRRTAERHQLDFPLLVDADHEAARMYGALAPDGGRVLRTVYVIDKGGHVAFRARGCPPTEEILGAVK